MHAPSVAATKSTCPNCESAETSLRTMQEGLEQFAYAAGHDLRGPLGQVRTFAALLKKKYQENLGEDGHALCGHIEAAATSAVVLVEALHTYAQAITSPATFEPLDGSRLLASALAPLDRQIQAVAAEVTHTEMPELTGDSPKLIYLFRQLIENALKFRSEEQPRIHISAEAVSGASLFSVRDNGIGIAPRFLEDIFKPLRRLNGYQYPGTGIGLAICRHIVELHAGRIWAESEPGRGSLIQFTIPNR